MVCRAYSISDWSLIVITIKRWKIYVFIYVKCKKSKNHYGRRHSFDCIVVVFFYYVRCKTSYNRTTEQNICVFFHILFLLILSSFVVCLLYFSLSLQSMAGVCCCFLEECLLIACGVGPWLPVVLPLSAELVFYQFMRMWYVCVVLCCNVPFIFWFALMCAIGKVIVSRRSQRLVYVWVFFCCCHSAFRTERSALSRTFSVLTLATPTSE